MMKVRTNIEICKSVALGVLVIRIISFRHFLIIGWEGLRSAGSLLRVGSSAMANWLGT